MNCRPLSIIIVFGMLNRHTIFRHTKFCTFLTKMDASGSTSILEPGGQV